MAKSNSTAQQWELAIDSAKEAIAILVNIQTEIQEKLDNIAEDKLEEPETLRYQEICDLELDTAYDIISEAEAVVFK